jgi:hypothetical protein
MGRKQSETLENVIGDWDVKWKNVDASLIMYSLQQSLLGYTTELQKWNKILWISETPNTSL